LDSYPVYLWVHNAVFVKVVNTVVENTIQWELRVHYDNKPVILCETSTAHCQWHVINELVQVSHFGPCLKHLGSLIGCCWCWNTRIKHVNEEVVLILIL